MKNFKVGDVVYLKQKIEDYSEYFLDLSFEVERITPLGKYPYTLVCRPAPHLYKHIS